MKNLLIGIAALMVLALPAMAQDKATAYAECAGAHNALYEYYFYVLENDQAAKPHELWGNAFRAEAAREGAAQAAIDKIVAAQAAFYTNKIQAGTGSVDKVLTDKIVACDALAKAAPASDDASTQPYQGSAR